MCKHRRETRRKALALLRHDGTALVRQLRQIHDIRSRTHDRHIDLFLMMRQRYRVVEKTAIKFGDRWGWKSLSQASLDACPALVLWP